MATLNLIGAGADGKSAYDLALEAAGLTTEDMSLQEWLDGLSAKHAALPDEVDQTDPTYFYFGWADVNGGWLIQRQTRASSQTASATTGFLDLTSAWAVRETLGYT